MPAGVPREQARHRSRGRARRRSKVFDEDAASSSPLKPHLLPRSTPRQQHRAFSRRSVELCCPPRCSTARQPEPSLRGGHTARQVWRAKSRAAQSQQHVFDKGLPSLSLPLSGICMRRGVVFLATA